MKINLLVNSEILLILINIALFSLMIMIPNESEIFSLKLGK